MKDDGKRLYFSIRKNVVNVQDTLSGAMLSYKNGRMLQETLQRCYVASHITSLTEALNTYKHKRLLIGKPDVALEANKTDFIIRENSHFNWSIMYMGYAVSVINNKIEYNAPSSVISLLCSDLAEVYSNLMILNAVVKINNSSVMYLPGGPVYSYRTTDNAKCISPEGSIKRDLQKIRPFIAGGIIYSEVDYVYDDTCVQILYEGELVATLAVDVTTEHYLKQ